MPGRRRPVLAFVALLLGGALASSGCATDIACPAIAHLNTVTLDTSRYPAAAAVQFCIDEECSSAPGEPEDSTSLLGVALRDGGDWSLMLDMRAPDEILIRLFDAQAAMVHESEEKITWTFSDGPCPGPATSESVVLR